jgi:RsiW-degrading membrane proteinase PrsW (M82 family)
VLLTTTLLYLTLAACGLGMGLMVFKYDLHRTEPWWLVITSVLLGAGLMEVAGHAQTFAVKHLVKDAHAFTGHFPSNTVLALLAATTEEIAKFIAVACVALCCRRHFDEPVDGLIYGAFAGLGAAIAESIATMGFGHDSPFLPAQEPIRLAGHLVMGGIGGFGIGLITNRSRYRFLAIPGCLLLAMLIHTLWDIIAFDAADVILVKGQLRTWHTVLPIILMVAGMLCFRWLISIGCAMTHVHIGVKGVALDNTGTGH